MRRNAATPDYLVVKKYDFETQWPANDAINLCRGEAIQVRFIAPQVQLSKHVFQYIFEQLGGLQRLWSRLGNPDEDR